MTIAREVKHTTTLDTGMKPVRLSGQDFGRCTIVFYPPSFVWQRLQEFHRASLRKPDKKHLAPKQARSYFDAVRTASLAQLWVGSDATRAAWFNHLLDAIAKSHSFDGLETPFLSGLNTAQVAGHHDAVKRAVHLWHQFGPPAHLGGGHSRSPVLDTKTNSIVFVDHKGLSALGPRGAHAALIDPKAGGVLAGSKAAGIFDAGVAQDGDSCERNFKAGGAVVGMLAGGLAGGITGAPTVVGAAPGAVAGGLAGGAAGATIGGALGGVICPGYVEGGSAEGAGGGTAAGTPSGDPDADPSTSIMFGDDDTSNQSSSEGNQSSSDQNQSSSDQNQSSSDGSNQSGGDGNDSSGSGSGNDTSGGMPDPDDPHGMPSPDDPHGFGWISDTCAYGSVASHMSFANGAWSFSSVPRLAADGTIASAGFLAAIPAIAALVNGQSQSRAQVEAQSQVEQVQAGTVVDKGVLGAASHEVETP